jgi:hypothetical protein
MASEKIVDRRPARWGANAALAAVASIVVLAAGEAFVRGPLRGRFERPPDDLGYRHDPELGWFPRESSEKTFAGPRLIHIHHGPQGFRDREHGAKERPRLAVVGDSFVWGYNVEADERFTEKLQEQLPRWEVVNLGVSGYGTDQEYLLSRRVLPALRPDVVLLVYCLNDSHDNRMNWRYGAYKPYFEKEGGELRLEGVPVPVCLAYRYRQHPWLFQSFLARGVVALVAPDPARVTVANPTRDLLANEHALAQSLGARFAVAFVEKDDGYAAFCRESGIPFLDLAGAEQYPEVGHWTPAGQSVVADRVRMFLGEQGWLESR